MNRNRWLIFGGVAALFLVGVALVIWDRLGEPKLGGEGEPTAASAPQTQGEPGEGTAVRLFFPAQDGLLHIEERRIQLTEAEEADEAAVAASLEEAGKNGAGGNNDSLRLALAPAVVTALLDGPQQEGLRRAYDEGTAVVEVRLLSGGVAIVSLQPAPGSVNRGLGSRAELLRVYSLIDSLAYSVPGIRSVMIVWAGSQPQTLGGHVDTSWPLFPSLDWVAADSRRLVRLRSSGEESGGAAAEAGAPAQ